jgi:hypothetical protein
MRSKRIVKDLKVSVESNHCVNRSAVCVVLLIITLVIASTRMRADTGTCGGQMITLPFTDVPSSNLFFCVIAEAYLSGLTFDGDSVTVVRVKDSQGNPLPLPFVLTTLTGNGLNGPLRVAFDGQRILITNNNVDSVSLWRATDLTPLGSFDAGAGSEPFGACSDGVNFWVTLYGTDKLARF